MNLLDAYVTMVLIEPYKQYGKWWVDVEYDCEETMSETSLMLDNFEEAAKIKPGYKFST